MDSTHSFLLISNGISPSLSASFFLLPHSLGSFLHLALTLSLLCHPQELEQIEETWRSEAEQLAERVTELHDENRRLRAVLQDREGQTEQLHSKTTLSWSILPPSLIPPFSLQKMRLKRKSPWRKKPLNCVWSATSTETEFAASSATSDRRMSTWKLWAFDISIECLKGRLMFSLLAVNWIYLCIASFAPHSISNSFCSSVMQFPVTRLLSVPWMNVDAIVEHLPQWMFHW